MEEKQKRMKDLTPEERKAIREEIWAPFRAEYLDFTSGLFTRLLEDAKPGDLTYFLILWSKVETGDPETQILAIRELVETYFTKHKVIPHVGSRNFADYLYRRREWLNCEELNEPLRDEMRDYKTRWDQEVLMPEVYRALLDPKSGDLPIFEALEALRKTLRRNITGDLKETTRPYSKKTTVALVTTVEEDTGDIHMLIPPTVEDKDALNINKVPTWRDAEATGHPWSDVRGAINDRLRNEGFEDAEGYTPEEIVAVQDEFNRLSEHQQRLLSTLERGEIAKYALESGRSVQALYKERKRLLGMVKENVQIRITKAE